MKKNLEAKKVWRMSFFVTLAISLIYGVKFVSKNYIFNIGQINLFDNQGDAFLGLPSKLTLPIMVSRFWDLIFIFIIIFFIIKTLYYIKKLKNRNNYMIGGLVFSLIIGFTIGGLSGFVIGLPLGIIIGLEATIFFGFFFGLLLGLTFGAEISFMFGFEASITAGLVAGLVFILAFGSVPGIICGLIFGLAMFIGTVIGIVVKHLFSKEVWGIN